MIEITGTDQRNCSPSLREDTQHLEVWQSQSQKPENYQTVKTTSLSQRIMPKVTYQTKTPSNLTEFCEAMIAMFGKVERDSGKALSIGKNLNDLKQIDQKHYGINARHFYSLHGSLKGKISRCLKCYSNQIYQLEFAIKAIEKRTPTIDKKFNDLPINFGISTLILGRRVDRQSERIRRKIDIWQKDSQEQAVCLFHNNYARGLIASCLSMDRHDRSWIFWHPLLVRKNWALKCIVMTPLGVLTAFWRSSCANRSHQIKVAGNSRALLQER